MTAGSDIGAERPARPTIAQLREVTQPPSVRDRAAAEHWVAHAYLRDISPYLTRILLRAGFSANGVTWLMIISAAAAAVATGWPSLVGAILVVILVQLQMLLDCSDGEVARWRGTSSPVGIYLDRLAHWVTEVVLPIALGIRADGGWDSLGGWTTLGLVIAVVVALVKAEGALMHWARAEAGKPVMTDTREVAAPRVSGLARMRRTLAYLPFYRAFVAVEFTLLALIAAIVDKAAGDLDGTRVLLTVLLPIAAVTAVGHLAAILASSRLR